MKGIKFSNKKKEKLYVSIIKIFINLIRSTTNKGIINYWKLKLFSFQAATKLTKTFLLQNKINPNLTGSIFIFIMK